ncbi:hypothetical protein MSPP1_002910 [Malassezia sp. CBS 17886]|nr:hypothetical protein MSPP1_002910 [Malassezia sp. CBS 17886]
MQQQGGYYPQQGGYGQGGYGQGGGYGGGGGYSQQGPMGGSMVDQRRSRAHEKHGMCGPCCAFLVGILACCCAYFRLEDIICAGCLDSVF